MTDSPWNRPPQDGPTTFEDFSEDVTYNVTLMRALLKYHERTGKAEILTHEISKRIESEFARAALAMVEQKIDAQKLCGTVAEITFVVGAGVVEHLVGRFSSLMRPEAGQAVRVLMLEALTAAIDRGLAEGEKDQAEVLDKLGTVNNEEIAAVINKAIKKFGGKREP